MSGPQGAPDPASAKEASAGRRSIEIENKTGRPDSPPSPVKQQRSPDPHKEHEKRTPSGGSKAEGEAGEPPESVAAQDLGSGSLNMSTSQNGAVLPPSSRKFSTGPKKSTPAKGRVKQAQPKAPPKATTTPKSKTAKTNAVKDGAPAASKSMSPGKQLLQCSPVSSSTPPVAPMPEISLARRPVAGSVPPQPALATPMLFDQTTSALIRSIAVLGIELANSPRPFTGVFVVLERGDGSKKNPYDGEVIDCGSVLRSAAFEEAFKDSFWRARRPHLGSAAASLPAKLGGALNFGSAAHTGRTSAKGDAGAAAGGSTGDDEGSDEEDAEAPTMTVHSAQVMREAKEAPLGTKTIPDDMVPNALAALGIRSLGQLTPDRMRRLFKAISASVNAATATKTQWTWAHICPLEMLVNEWSWGQSGTIHALCLYPPWHPSKRPKADLRRVAVLLAGTLDDAWRYFLCVEFGVAWKADLVFQMAPACGSLLPKKRLFGAAVKGVTSDTTAKKKRVESNGVGGIAGATGTVLSDSYRTQAGERSLVQVVEDADGASLVRLATMEEMATAATFKDRSIIIEHLPPEDVDRAAVMRANKDLGVLLPTTVVCDCMEYYDYDVGLRQDNDDESGVLSPILKVKAMGLDPSVLTRSAVMTMFDVHSYNDDVGSARRAFEWLDQLIVSTDNFSHGLAMLRIGALRVTQEAARKAAREVAEEARDCEQLGLVINLNNNHWASAVVDVRARRVVVYDSLSGVEADEKSVAVDRVLMLCRAVEAKKATRSAAERVVVESGGPWTVDHIDQPQQVDGYNCGAFAVAHVVCALTGVDFSKKRPQGNLLRLALVHTIMDRGELYREAWNGCSSSDAP
ncbi:hypothetical protein I4F81_001756 [Pyropia yezoensis]|uniref:Uncharacterized protein n=1 Tax=Pyropia yezoensis TaxID=2788 RepID=A0ACC3BMF0_PYRYE|nr:hypothetical protein I4F81_001756 [Neopyropia yezoensis]